MEVTEGEEGSGVGLKKGVIDEATKREISRRFQEAAVGHLVMQLRRALRELESRNGLPDRLRNGVERRADPVQPVLSQRQEDGVTPIFPIRGLVVSGGVACNLYLRERYVAVPLPLHSTSIVIALATVCQGNMTNRVVRLREMLEAHSPERRIPLYYPPIELCTGGPIRPSLISTRASSRSR
jgi:tRNA A37 threonylcarbamoyltransferase TsaD